MKREFLVISVILFLIVVAGILSFSFDLRDYEKKVIGGEKDENNCLIGAGYSFDEDVGACTRGWEINEDNLKEAARIAVDSDGRDGLTVINVEVLNCQGCFSVSLDYNSDRDIVRLSNWEVTEEEIFSIAECTALGGRIVGHELGNECSEDEKEVGCVDGCFVESICCVGV